MQGVISLCKNNLPRPPPRQNATPPKKGGVKKKTIKNSPVLRARFINIYKKLIAPCKPKPKIRPMIPKERKQRIRIRDVIIAHFLPIQVSKPKIRKIMKARTIVHSIKLPEKSEKIKNCIIIKAIIKTTKKESTEVIL